MQETKNLKLKKPDLTDYVNVGDLNENADIIDEAITENKESLATHLAERASLDGVGHVQLSNATDSNSETLSATPKAVKTVMDRADEAFTLGNSRKKELVDLLLSLDDSLPIDYSLSWEDILNETENVSTGKKWATGDVRSSYDYHSGSGVTGVGYKVMVDNLTFAPSIVILSFIYNQHLYYSIYLGGYDQNNTICQYSISTPEDGTRNLKTSATIRPGVAVDSTGFVAYVDMHQIYVNYLAFE